MYLKQRTVTHNTREQAPNIPARWTWTDDTKQRDGTPLTYAKWLIKIKLKYGDDITEGPLKDNPETGRRAELKGHFNNLTDPAAKELFKALFKEVVGP